jgi:RNA polymerase sigma factor (sigma-70 family)
MRTKYPTAGGPDISEATLFQQAQAGCPQSLNRLMARHDGLAQAVVRRQVLGDLPFAEALQAARIGLWHAILGYDPQRGVAFSSYAWPSIMRAVWRAVKTQPTCLTVHALPPTAEEADPVVASERADIEAALHQLVERLPAHLRAIIIARYGMAGDSPASFRQMGGRWGLSGERMRQLHTEALVWLRHPPHAQLLRSLLGHHRLADYQWADELAQTWLRRRGGRHGR